MTEERNWRDAKPKWIVDAAIAEIEKLERKVALSWPDEAEPQPMPFYWGEYDKLHGEPEEGTYFTLAFNTVLKVELRRVDDHWRKWEFCVDGKCWTNSVVKGPLYRSRRDAYLAMLWSRCHEAAERLARIRRALDRAED